MRNAVHEAEALDSNHIGQVASRIAHGAMMGSRGNSGTILSQLWQGFAQALRDQQVLTAELLVLGLREAADAAYRGVIKPVEGTILTVTSARMKSKFGDSSNTHVAQVELPDGGKARVWLRNSSYRSGDVIEVRVRRFDDGHREVVPAY